MAVGELFCLTAGDIPLDRGGLFKFGNFENRKGAAKPRPLCTPLGLFLSSARDSLFLFVDLCLYASVFSALRCADVVLFLHFLCGSLPARCLYSSILSALRCADVVLFLHFLCGSLLARCLYSSVLSALRYADVVLFLHFLYGSLPAKCLYASIFNVLRYADIISFLHFLCDSLLAKCPYSSILSALRVAISRFESQPASPRRPFTNRSTTATTTTQPSSAAPMAQNLPSSLPISHNQTTNQAATLSHNITTFTPSDTTPKHPPYKPQAAHKPPAVAQPGSWNSRPYKPRSTPYSAPYQ